MSETINTSKTEALRALYMLEHSPRDFSSHTIQHILTEERAQTSTNIVIGQQDHVNSPSNDPQQLLEQQSQINGHEQSQTPSPNNDPPQNQQPSQNIDPPQPPQSSPINDPQVQLVQSPISHPLQLTNHSPPNSPSQPPSHNPSPTNEPQHPQSPSPHNDPTQEITHSSPGLNPLPPPPPFSPSDDPSPTPSIANEQHEHNRWDRVESFCNKYLINQGYWIDKKTREQLMVAATVIATMTFQSVISPPGGVWQEDTTKGGYACPDYGFCEAGTAVVGYVWSPDYLKFIFFNSASFFASLCVLLVLVSGFPLHNKFIVWVLAVLMIVAITCMLLTYMWALGLVSPNHIFYRIRDLGFILVGIWSFLLFVVCLIQIARIVFWVRSKRRSSSRSSSSTDVAL